MALVALQKFRLDMQTNIVVIGDSSPVDIIGSKFFFKLITNPLSTYTKQPDHQDILSYINSFEMIHLHLEAADSYIIQHYHLQCLTFDRRRFDSSGTPIN